MPGITLMLLDFLEDKSSTEGYMCKYRIAPFWSEGCMSHVSPGREARACDGVHFAHAELLEDNR